MVVNSRFATMAKSKRKIGKKRKKKVLRCKMYHRLESKASVTRLVSFLSSEIERATGTSTRRRQFCLMHSTIIGNIVPSNISQSMHKISTRKVEIEALNWKWNFYHRKHSRLLLDNLGKRVWSSVVINRSQSRYISVHQNYYAARSY